MKQRTLGITMLELLIALALLGTVFLIASNGIVGSLQAQRLNQTTVNNQAKLRRVMEVLSQDLRSAVLGGLTGSPFTSNDDSISFSLLDGGAGFPITSLDLDDGTLTVQAQDADTLDIEIGTQILVVNPGGDGILMPVSTIAADAAPQRFNITFDDCTNSIDPASSYLLFKVKTIGLEYDDANDRLMQREGTSGVSTPVAFGISDFTLTYIYEPFGTSVGVPIPLSAAKTVGVGGWPLKVATDVNAASPGDSYSLVRVKVAISSDEGRGTRSYEAYIDLNNISNNVRLGRLIPCN